MPGLLHLRRNAKTILGPCVGGLICYLAAVFGISLFSFQPSNITIL